MRVPRRGFLAVALLCCLASSAHAAPARLRGTVESLTGDTLIITVRGAARVTLTLADTTAVIAVVPFDLAEIKPGSYVGTAAVPGKGGTLVALEVHVFPEAMRGTGEGHRPFDLQPDSTMTNGTVGDVVGTTARTLTVTYKGGEKTVQVPEGTPVVTMAPANRDLLVPGAHVIVFAENAADGTLTATRVLAGKDGLTPPM
jgi:hypothetical protein